MTPFDLINLAGGLTPTATGRIMIVSQTRKDPAGRPFSIQTDFFKVLQAPTAEQPQSTLMPEDEVVVVTKH
jgi:hypothetical protein